MNKSSWIIHVIFGALAVSILFLLTHRFDPLLFSIITAQTGKRVQSTWPGYLNTALVLALVAGFFAWLKIAWDLPNRAWLTQIRQDTSQPPEAGKFPFRLSRADGFILLFFVACSIILFLDKIQGPYPYVKWNSDAGNIASFAAAQKYPDLFKGDELLSSPENLRSYSTMNVLLIQLLESWVGNFALAFAWLSIPQVIINLSGFYFFGMVLFEPIEFRQRRFWALLLTIVLAIPYAINLLETWGISPDPVTRFDFQALLPYLLALVILWRNRPRWWPVLIILTGLMSFVHPVSAPAWAFAIWLGMAVLLPETWKGAKKFLAMAGMVALMGAALFPYMLNFLGNYSMPRPALSYEFTTFIIKRYFPGNILNIPQSLLNFGKITWASGLLPISVVGVCILLYLRWHDSRKVKLALVWAAGVLFVSTVVPWVEHMAEDYFKIAPIQTELVRGLRYMVFFMLLLSVWALAEIYRRVTARRERYLMAGVALALAAAWMFTADTSLIIPGRLINCVKMGHIVCVQFDDEDRIVQAVRERTPPGAVLFSTFANQDRLSYSLAFRYLGLRSLAFSYKDRGQLVTARSPDIKTWYDRFIAMNALSDQTSEQQVAGYFLLARQWGASYLVADFKIPADILQTQKAQLVYENDSFQLVQLGNE